MNKISLSTEQTQKMKEKAYLSLDKFKDKKVLVIGDIGLDEYIKGEVSRISPEAPVPVLNVTKTESRLGLAANVAQNITSLGASCELVSIIGNDDSAKKLNALLNEAKINLNFVVDNSRPTTKKSRVIHEAHHIVRIDYEKKEFISSEIEEKILQKVEKVLPDCDIVIIEDYNKGVLTNKLTQNIISLSKKNNKLVLVDPHETTPLEFYKGADIITPNTLESFALLNISRDSILDSSITPAVLAEKMLSILGSDRMVITQGKDGMSIFENQQWLHTPTQAKQVYDVTGAGDTVIAAIGLGLSSGLELSTSCLLANFAAGIVVAQVGCIPCELSDLRKSLT